MHQQQYIIDYKYERANNGERPQTSFANYTRSNNQSSMCQNDNNFIGYRQFKQTFKEISLSNQDLKIDKTRPKSRIIAVDQADSCNDDSLDNSILSDSPVHSHRSDGTNQSFNFKRATSKQKQSNVAILIQNDQRCLDVVKRSLLPKDAKIISPLDSGTNLIGSGIAEEMLISLEQPSIVMEPICMNTPASFKKKPMNGNVCGSRRKEPRFEGMVQGLMIPLEQVTLHSQRKRSVSSRKENSDHKSSDDVDRSGKHLKKKSTVVKVSQKTLKKLRENQKAVISSKDENKGLSFVGISKRNRF